MTLEHGGNISAAARRFNIPETQWIDLSTGISPWSWPVPTVPQSVWQTLPQADDRLERAAADYYRCGPEGILAVPGSQYALQFTPSLLQRGRVAMPLRGYTEHRLAWRAAGHSIVDYSDGAALADLVDAAVVDHAVVINPNNPTAERLPKRALESVHRRLQDRGGWLVVDEAFIDATPEASLAGSCPSPGLAIYRSVGKYFGLAGIRLGFLLAPSALCEQLATRMPPWQLSHPARWIGERALADDEWQRAQRSRLDTASSQWLRMLQQRLPALEFDGTALFATGSGTTRYCSALNQALARRAVLLRLFDSEDGHSALRFGLPVPDARERVLELIVEAAGECACATG
jgi:cobalamin biosynthetic protein CobC